MRGRNVLFMYNMEINDWNADEVIEEQLRYFRRLGKKRLVRYWSKKALIS